MDMTPAQAAALWSGLLILLMVVLAIRVVGARRANRIVIGDGGNAQLILATRVFGNAAEYIPAGIGALAILTLLGMPAWPLHAVGGTLFLGRLIHAAGLSEKKATLARVVGMALTFTALIAAAGMLIVHAFVGGSH
ncbi:glutathione S-transferase [Brevundimonas sp. LM2]|uniref:MAPEG family protein n=1 Tax=Brevundimonas sp. LM2 TaxID=1938605 RepID=UPI000983DC46|nr:MAPEG family protein [Brevundimonas sp. LM2]AQR61831.1 glutathione S-transferase [Brevundimonas sp. LM2]